ncbi:MAG: hypothetical protein Q9M91_00210 [Candidatus Dojkabacteria bacterium]|nr:hypothetical protein [Candidatus Dojkabacteria bacterium]MDQ7020255.1 hypothetical protein [Candidatus Dojkabacteria bacterium]
METIKSSSSQFNPLEMTPGVPVSAMEILEDEFQEVGLQNGYRLFAERILNSLFLVREEGEIETSHFNIEKDKPVTYELTEDLILDLKAEYARDKGIPIDFVKEFNVVQTDLDFELTGKVIQSRLFLQDSRDRKIDLTKIADRIEEIDKLVGSEFNEHEVLEEGTMKPSLNGGK